MTRMGAGQGRGLVRRRTWLNLTPGQGPLKWHPDIEARHGPRFMNLGGFCVLALVVPGAVESPMATVGDARGRCLSDDPNHSPGRLGDQSSAVRVRSGLPNGLYRVASPIRLQPRTQTHPTVLGSKPLWSPRQPHTLPSRPFFVSRARSDTPSPGLMQALGLTWGLTGVRRRLGWTP